MVFYGALTHLTTIAFRQNSQNITLEPNTGTTYTAARTWQLPPGDTSGILVSEAGTQTLTNKTISGSSNTLTVLAGTQLSGQTPIANGGTGASTKSAGFDALSPMTTAGDTIYGGTAGTGTRLAAGTAHQVLHSGTTPTWSAVDLAADVTGVLPTANGGTGQNSTATFPTSGIVVTEAATETLTNKTISGSSNTLTVLAGTQLTGQVPIANGGTGASTKTAGFDALSPMTTLGDLILGGASGTGTRLGIGTTGQTLTVAGGTATWATPSSSTFNTDWVTGDGTTKTVTHNLGSLDVIVQFYDKTDGTTIDIDSTARTDTNTLTLTASEAPAAAGWRVMVIKA